MHGERVIEGVRQMKRAGASNAEIAMSCGITEGSVKWICHRYGIRRPMVIVRVGFHGRRYEQLASEAAKRGVKPSRLVQRLVRLAFVGDLVTAILDDGDDD